MIVIVKRSTFKYKVHYIINVIKDDIINISTFKDNLVNIPSFLTSVKGVDNINSIVNVN